jgi:hypothetical protein
MSYPHLLTLDLREDLAYRNLPPLQDLGSQDEAVKAWFPELDEGEERLHILDAASFDFGGDGPGVALPLPSPTASYARSGLDTLPGGAAFILTAGSYLFFQWRPTSMEELAEGLEWFAREAWWEGRSTVGPTMLRLVCEDGRLARQALRRLAEIE